MTTTTTYPDADPETTTVDGAVGDRSGTWSAMQNGTGDGPVATDSGTGTAAFVGQGLYKTAKWQHDRAFFLFDTSSIGDSDTLDSATLDLYATTQQRAKNTAYDFLVVVQSSPASNTALTTSDFGNCGSAQSPTEGSDHIEIVDVTTSAYQTFTLNATGEGYVDFTGVTKLGVRGGDEFQSSAPSGWTSGNGNRVIFNTAENSGTSTDPKLIVEHTGGSAAADNALSICNF